MKQTILIFIIALFPILASADGSGTCGNNLTWSYVNATKTLTISGTGEMGSFYYESNGGGTYICAGAPWYSYVNNIEKVIIQSGVTSISNYAFSGCSSMTSLTISNTVTSIGEYAFSDCSSLSTISIPNVAINIGDCAFVKTAWYMNQPDGLVYLGKIVYKYKGEMPANTSLSIKEGTLAIASSAFSSCSNLTSITIPNSVTVIGSWAFAWCSGLTSFDIPKGVKDICFLQNCTGLTSIDIPNGVTSVSLTGCSGLSTLVIPNGVTYLGDFSGCTSLTSISIPSSVTSIGGKARVGNWAFMNCYALNAVYINDLEAWCKIETGYSHSFEEIYNNPLYFAHHLYLNGDEVTNIVIPDGISELSATFQGCTNISSVIIPSSVTSLGETFADCTGLASITCLNTVPPQCINTGGSYSSWEDYAAFTFKDVDKDECVLLVPQGCVSVYKNAAYWGEFKNIEELKRGDANGDGLVNVADIVFVVNIIKEGAYNKLADMNNDGVVDNKDLSSIKDIIMKAG